MAGAEWEPATLEMERQINQAQTVRPPAASAFSNEDLHWLLSDRDRVIQEPDQYEMNNGSVPLMEAGQIEVPPLAREKWR